MGSDQHPLDPAPRITTLVDWLLAPHDLDDFLRNHWERELLHIPRDDAAYFRELFTLADLDRLVSGVALPATNLDLAQDSTPFAKGDYTIDGRLDPATVLRLHAGGATIILRALEQWCRPLDRLTRSAAADFGAAAQVNLYATPPANQSTPPHWDTHELFILQIHGDKVWNIYESDRPLPLESERFTPDRFSVGPLREKVLLRPGDVLYLPRGTIHEPQADSYSIHVSLGVMVTRVAQVIEDVVRLASSHLLELRRGLPPTVADVSDRQVENEILGAFRALIDRDLVRAALVRRRHLLATYKPDVTGWLAAIATPEPPADGWMLRRRDGVEPFVEEDEAGCRLHWLTQSMVLEASVGSFLAAHRQFTVAELPVSGGTADRVELARALIVGGLLERVDDADAPTNGG